MRLLHELRVNLRTGEIAYELNIQSFIEINSTYKTKHVYPFHHTKGWP